MFRQILRSKFLYHRSNAGNSVLNCKFSLATHKSPPKICLHYSTETGIGKYSAIDLSRAGEEKQGHRSWWDIGTEWKIIASVVVAVTSFIFNARSERRQLQQEMKLNRVQNQIKNLYGPLYGNRLVSETSYRAIMKNHCGLKKYLHEARRKRDADMIRRWRSFVWEVLYPLDKAAVEMICNNAHLVSNGEFPKEFEQLLVHAAKMEFVMEHWKNDDGHLESTKQFTEDDYLEVNNASGIGRHNMVLQHVKGKYDELMEEQNQLSLAICSEKNADNILTDIFKRAIH